MAATPSRPSNNQNASSNNNYKIEQTELNDTRNNSVDNSDSSSSVNDNISKIENIKKSSCVNCKCTNISIMQLFHEMKQEFPKIPDDVVSQCVLDNCHNRNACIDKLRNETISLIQAYPSQIFKRDNGLKGANHNHNNNTSENNNTSKAINCVNNKISDKKENYSDMSQSPINKQISQDNNNNVNNQNSHNNNINNNNSHNDSDICLNNGGDNIHHAQRPNTLNFVKEPHNSVSAFSKPVIKPRRTAPPPPPSTTSSTPTPQSPPLHQQQIQSQQQQQQQQQQQNPNHFQPTSFVDRVPPAQSQPEAIVSLNVKVSPVTGRPPIRPRHTSELSIQPQQPFFRDIHANARSYTSVYFNLRPPSDNPQSPINITAGPSLTYSSSSFDARQGHQNQLQITIGDGSGLISAMRAQPRNLQVSRSVDDERGRMDGYKQETNENQYLIAEIIHKQLKQKERLSMELKNNKKHLDSLQREIRALQSPLPPGGSIRLADEITRLQSVCQNMTQEVEEAGVYVIGETNEAFYNNIYTGQKLSIQNRPSRPPRPPPPAARSVSQPVASGGGGSYNLSSLVSNSNLINNNSALNSINNCNLINNNNLLPNSHISNNDNNNNHNNINNNNNNYSEEPWICSVCTFQNHPLLDTCEQCEMIKFNTVDSSSNNGGTGMIQITGAHFMPRIDERLLKSSTPCTPPSPPPPLLTSPTTTNGSFASPTSIANNTNTHPSHLVNGFMLPN